MHATRQLSPESWPARRLSRALLTLLLALGLRGAPVAAEESFLPPEQAFQVAGELDGANAVRVRWTIADGYYLYKNKFRFTSPFPDVVIGDPELPAALKKHDTFFGDVEIYRGQVEVRVPFTRPAPGAGALTIEAGSQGCADAGLCYPPQRQQLVLPLPVAVSATATPLKPAAANTAPLARAPTGGGAPNIARTIATTQGFGVEDDLLTAEQAFRFQADVMAPDLIQLTWEIAPGTYLYRDKVEIALDAATDVALGAFTLPAGEVKQNSVLPDGRTGDVEVYHGRVTLALPLIRGATAATEITLVAKYQGCAERGIC
ncbi:MAG TPA: protein-disulfide reductase DsbD domain-containing protein, partial [Lamprocystis sp. (in: g-proteobacteria)]|nr:protein-disulfide reductase DsbD domain-containing protein [Lamprocystis sp. (in: g-proteobacteria)]